VRIRSAGFRTLVCALIRLTASGAANAADPTPVPAKPKRHRRSNRDLTTKLTDEQNNAWDYRIVKT
jgi:hypothetical protein